MALNGVEASRLAGVLEDAMDKLAFLSQLGGMQAAAASASLGGGGGAAAAAARGAASQEEVMRTLEDQRSLEVRYDELVQLQLAERASGGKCGAEEQAALDARYERLMGSDGSALPVKARLVCLRGELAAVSGALRDDMKQLGRLLADSAGDDGAGAHCAEERSGLQALLSGAVAELGRENSYARLAAAVAREQEAGEAARRVEAREAAVAREVERLSGELAREASAHAEALRAKEAGVRAAGEALLRARGENGAAVRFARKEASAGGEALARLLGQGVEGLEAALAGVRRAAAEEGAAFEASRELLTASVAEEAEATEGWKRRLAAELPAAVEALARAEEARAGVLAELGALQGRYEQELQAAGEKLVRWRASAARTARLYAWMRSHTRAHTHAPRTHARTTRTHSRPLRRGRWRGCGQRCGSAWRRRRACGAAPPASPTSSAPCGSRCTRRW